MAQKVTARDLVTMKIREQRFPMVTAYDFSTARLADAAGIPAILVGDSLGMVVLGYDSTVPVTMDDMVHHTRAVTRGAGSALVIGDLPFMSYHLDASQALANSGRLLQEGGAQAVKLEGGQVSAGTVRRIVESGIPVMGHIGLTPQSVNRFGGYRVLGKTRDEAAEIYRDAVALEEAGAFAVVLELVAAPLARLITGRLSIPTIGIGSGPNCDGQVQVLHDILGLSPDFAPRHARRYAHLAETITDAFRSYAREVVEGAFPSDAESTGMDESVLEGLEAEVARVRGGY